MCCVLGHISDLVIVRLLQDLPEKVKEYEVSRHSLFFNDTGANRIYKTYVKTIIERENSINGRLYKEDPTIMSWGLLNEPRCETWKVDFLTLFTTPSACSSVRPKSNVCFISVSLPLPTNPQCTDALQCQHLLWDDLVLYCCQSSHCCGAGALMSEDVPGMDQ